MKEDGDPAAELEGILEEFSVKLTVFLTSATNKVARDLARKLLRKTNGYLSNFSDKISRCALCNNPFTVGHKLDCPMGQKVSGGGFARPLGGGGTCKKCGGELTRFANPRATLHIACRFSEGEQDAMLARKVADPSISLKTLAKENDCGIDAVAKALRLAMGRRGFLV